MSKKYKLSLRRCTKEEKKMQIQHILFDLDGTLLPMNQDEFVTFYMPLLAKNIYRKEFSLIPKHSLLPYGRAMKQWLKMMAAVQIEKHYTPNLLISL